MSGPISLPGPDELPAADIVIYDGNCNFCIDQVCRLKRWDGRNRLCYLSLHDPFVTEQFPDLTHEELMAQMYVVNRKTKKAYGGARALRYLSRKLPRLWLLMPLLHIPFTLPLWQWSYRQVARRRYRIAGKKDANCDNDACEIHLK